MVENLSAESFLHVLRSFVAQWGYPELVLNGASQDIMMQNTKLINFLTQKGRILYQEPHGVDEFIKV